MTSGDREHWRRVWDGATPAQTSWYAAHLDDSLRLIRSVASRDARVLDVGAGASTLVDDLLRSGYRRLTALDCSATALRITRERLGRQADRVRWVVADVTTANLPRGSFDVWHDRALFHFMTSDRDRRRYVRHVRRTLVSGGHAIIGVFSPEGPDQCSGLAVAKYDAPRLEAAFGSEFELVRSHETRHVTPRGREQAFLFSVLRKKR